MKQANMQEDQAFQPKQDQQTQQSQNDKQPDQQGLQQPSKQKIQPLGKESDKIKRLNAHSYLIEKGYVKGMNTEAMFFVNDELKEVVFSELNEYKQGKISNIPGGIIPAVRFSFSSLLLSIKFIFLIFELFLYLFRLFNLPM
jgi:hypothetical protein